MLLICARPCAAELPARQTLVISRISHPIKIDGVLDPEKWKDAARVDRFWQWAPKEGAPATEKTIAYLAYDDKYLYVGFDAYDSTPSLVRATIAKREDVGEDDLVWISLDTFNDQRRAYEFVVNPYGVQEDVFMTPDTWDPTFDTVWDSAGKLNAHGFSVEMRIPFRSLRFGKKDPQTWGLQIHRLIRRKGEHVSWSPYFADRGHYFYQMGRLKGVAGVSGGHHVEVLPEFTQSYEAPGTWKKNAGVSLKYAPSPDSTFDGTFHPDYSQIELDPVQLLVNLRFPVYIPEKRPFFLERADAFQTPLTLVHTRTIITPQYGAKWTGKSHGTTFGLLSANDEAPVDGYAKTNVARLQQDIFKDSTLGVLYADRESGSYYNRVAGVDGRLHFGDVYTLRYQYVYSWENDRSRRRPLQSPGFTGSLTRTTRATGLSLSYTDLGANLRADTGFLPRVDVRNFSGSYSHTFWPEKERLASWGPSISYGRIYDHAGTLTDENLSASLTAENAVLGVSLGYSPNNLERFSGVDFHKNTANASLSAALSQYWTGSVSAGYGDGIHYSSPIELGDALSLSATANFKPRAQLKMSPTYLKAQLTEKGSRRKLSSQDTLRYRVDYQWTTRLSARIIVDYTRASDSGFDSTVWTVSSLATYMWHPATAVYAGYNRVEGRTASAPFSRQSEQAFLKLSYLFRL